MRLSIGCKRESIENIIFQNWSKFNQKCIKSIFIQKKKKTECAIDDETASSSYRKKKIGIGNDFVGTG